MKCPKCKKEMFDKVSSKEAYDKYKCHYCQKILSEFEITAHNVEHMLKCDEC